ncbi:MAG: glycosyl hydrolase 53 family protein [Planctomycetes bacterium]|nr:glycosyl hydrolase 53 family protein [Planctomycetota bacterium]
MKHWPAVILLGALCMAGCGGGDDGGGGDSSRRKGIDMGVSYSPEGWDTSTAQQVIDFYTGHAAYGNIVSYHTRWRDPGDTNGEIPIVAQSAQAAKTAYGIEPMVGFGWYDETSGPDLTSDSEPSNNTWSNTETRSEFQSMVVSYCSMYQPKYIFLGNETNTFYLGLNLPSEQAQWDDWVTQFQACYDAIKAVSPDTIIATVFQYEHLRGGGANVGWSDAAQWGLIANFGAKLDAVALTSYPHFDYTDPAAIPQTYYEELSTYWSGPVMFTELGWLADPAAPFFGSEQKQSDFVSRFFTLTQNLDLRYVTWAFLHDPPAGAINAAFSEIGLRSNDGTAVRMANATWQQEVSTRN